MATQKFMPCLWVEKDAKKVANYYLSIFKTGKLKSYKAYKNVNGPNTFFDMAVMNLQGMDFQILAAGPMFKFTEAVSFVITCKNQKEVDYYWKALSNKGGSEGPCGWCKDKYGLSWQVVPAQYFKLENHKNKAKQEYAFKAVMKMKKIIIADLEEKNNRLHPFIYENNPFLSHIQWQLQGSHDILPKMPWRGTKFSNNWRISAIRKNACENEKMYPPFRVAKW